MTKVWVNGPESADKVANIREKLAEAAKLKPRYEEKAAVRKIKRRANKEEKKRVKREAAAAYQRQQNEAAAAVDCGSK